MPNDNFFEIKNLSVEYVTDENIYRAVNGLDLVVGTGQCVGLVGETGAGKTTTALSIMQLLPQPAGVITQGEIWFKGRNILFNTERENRKLRGEGISMISQDPMTALNPTTTIGKQLVETLREHTKISNADAQEQAMRVLESVGIMRNRFWDYPHQLSGGQKQRVAIAMALLCKSELLIADEPTTALDVTIQAQVLDLMRKLMHERGMSVILITHDLGIVAENCDHVAIIYGGEVLESGEIHSVFRKPLHPYTIGLFRSIPRLDDDCDMLYMIEGQVANSAELPSGCVFHPRCPHATELCKAAKPRLIGTQDHRVKCHMINGGDI